MIRRPHENVATVLVAPWALPELELEAMGRDLRVWPVATAPVCTDGPRQAFQVRRRMLESHRGAWDLAADWTPVFISFGPSWYVGDEPLPWSAHETLWTMLAARGTEVRYAKRLGGVPKLQPPPDPGSADPGWPAPHPDHWPSQP